MIIVPGIFRLDDHEGDVHSVARKSHLVWPALLLVDHEPDSLHLLPTEQDHGHHNQNPQFFCSHWANHLLLLLLTPSRIPHKIRSPLLENEAQDASALAKGTAALVSLSLSAVYVCMNYTSRVLYIIHMYNTFICTGIYRTYDWQLALLWRIFIIYLSILENEVR